MLTIVQVSKPHRGNVFIYSCKVPYTINSDIMLGVMESPSTTYPRRGNTLTCSSVAQIRISLASRCQESLDKVQIK